MLDIANIPSSQNNVQTFTQAGAWATWVKPRKARYIQIFCLGGGGGGGSGYTNTIGGISPGAGGGAAAGYMQAGFQANILPDILYIYPGLGGTGGVPAASGVGSNGTAGGISYVTVTPDTSSVVGIVCRSSNTPAGGGTGSFNGGTAATVTTTANARMLNLGTFVASAGINGGTGGNLTAGTVTITRIVCPGTGGAGTTTANTVAPGGSIVGAGPFPSIAGSPGTNVANATSANGLGGTAYFKPIMGFTGGMGSGNSIGTNGIAGRGGNGAFGCGGGGGGSARLASGIGGDGGNGLVIITTYF